MNSVELYWAEVAQVEAARRARERAADRLEWIQAACLILFLATVTLTSLRVHL